MKIRIQEKTNSKALLDWKYSTFSNFDTFFKILKIRLKFYKIFATSSQSHFNISSSSLVKGSME